MKNVFVSQLEDAIAVLKLDKAKMEQISERKAATKWGIIIFVIPLVLNLIFASLNFPSGFGVIFSKFLLWPIVVPVLAVVGGIFLMSILAEKMFNAHGSHIGFFRTMSYSAIILWISVIPFLLAFLGIWDAFGLFNLVWVVAVIWILVVAYHMLLIHHKLNQKDAVVVLVAGVLGYFILKGILGRILVGTSYRLWY